jgi:hypothetical protein
LNLNNFSVCTSASSLVLVPGNYFCHCAIKGEKTKTESKQGNKQTKYTKLKCNTVSVSPSVSSPNSVIFSSKEEKKRKRVWRQLCGCLSEVVAHLPPTVCLLLLQALFVVDLRSELTLT